MGNDGGSIPTRRELVKEAARNPTASELKETQREHLAHRWSQCPVSHKALTKPVVSDSAGNLYNKDAIIQFLLPTEATSIDKDEYEKFIQGRMKSLKDVVEVQFEVEKDETTKLEKWVCPVTAKELGPAVKAVYIVPCGHAISQEAIKEMKGEQCIQCGQTYENRDVIPILPSSDVDKNHVITRIEQLRSLGLSHSLKKVAGSKKRKANGENKIDETAAVKVQTNAIASTLPQTSNGVSSSKTAVGSNGQKPFSGIKNAATANLTARVLEEEAAKKKQKLQNENISSLYSKKDSKNKHDGSFMTRGFSIPAKAKDG